MPARPSPGRPVPDTDPRIARSDHPGLQDQPHQSERREPGPPAAIHAQDRQAGQHRPEPIVHQTAPRPGGSDPGPGPAYQGSSRAHTRPASSHDPGRRHFAPDTIYFGADFTSVVHRPSSRLRSADEPYLREIVVDQFDLASDRAPAAGSGFRRWTAPGSCRSPRRVFCAFTVSAHS